MRTRSVTDVARTFCQALDAVEYEREEIVLIRHRKEVVRLVGEPASRNALEVFGDLHRSELRNPPAG